MYADRIKLICLISVFLFSSLLAGVEPSYARKAKIAIGDLDALGVDETLAMSASELLRTELFKTGFFDVTERKQMEKLLEEQKFQLSGATQEDIVNIGNLLAVELIVMGSINRMGKQLLINIRLVDVEKARVMAAETVNVLGEEEIPGAIKTLAKKISEAIPLRGKVVGFRGDEVVISLGSIDQMEKGITLRVQRLGEAFKDPTTGEILGRAVIEVAFVRIKSVMGESLSSAFVLQEYGDIRVGDIVGVWTGTVEAIPKKRAEAERLEQERLELERVKAETERKKLEAERRRLEAEKIRLEEIPSVPSTSPPTPKKGKKKRLAPPPISF